MIDPAYGDLFDIKRKSRSFQNVTAFDQSVSNLAAQGVAQSVRAARVDGDFFQTFQSSPEIGRAITAEDISKHRNKRKEEATSRELSNTTAKALQEAETRIAIIQARWLQHAGI